MNSKKFPLVTVGIPAYNHQDYVGEAIKSVVNQTYPNLELIIINDGSTDNTHEEILKYIEICKKRFIRFKYINRENKGLSVTLNEILEWANGKYFTLIASDDIILPNKIEDLVNTLENLSEDYAIAFGDAYFIDSNGKIIYLNDDENIADSQKGTKSFLEFYTRKRNLNYKNDNIFGSYSSLLEGNYLPAMSFLAKTEKFKEVGGWTPENMLEDWEMWLKLSKKYKFKYIDKPVALYRWYKKNTVKIYKNKLILDAIKLLLREKKYAKENDLYDIWEKSYFNHLVFLLKLKKFSYFIKYSKNINFYKFLFFTFKKIIKDILIKI